MVDVKTTILLKDKVYQRLVNESIKRHGNAKNISLTLNEILERKFLPTKSMFGKLSPFGLTDLRDENDRVI